MEYNKFKEIVNSIESHFKTTRKLHSLGVDILDLFDPIFKSISILIEEIYGKDGLNWLEWFMYESDFGKKDWSNVKVLNPETGKFEDKKDKYGAHDENGTPMCYSLKSTWEYLEKYHKK